MLLFPKEKCHLASRSLDLYCPCAPQCDPISSQNPLLPSGGPFLAHHGSKWRFLTRISSFFNVYHCYASDFDRDLFLFLLLLLFFVFFPMCDCVGGEPRPKIVSINNLSTIANTEASKTGWLYDLSRERWKGYTATRFLYFCGDRVAVSPLQISVVERSVHTAPQSVMPGCSVQS